MEIHDVLAGFAVFIGLVGIVVVFLPGLLLQVVAVVLWALEEDSVVGWAVLILVVVVAGAAGVLKYAHPGRELRRAGIPGWLILVAVLVAVVGLFVIPLLGAPLGFILTIYLFERARRGAAHAWPSTRLAVKAVLTSIGIELAGGFVIAIVYLTGAFLT